MINNTDDQIIEILDPHVKFIRTFYEEALTELNDMLNVSKTRINSGAKAKLFHNLVIERAKAYFNQVEGIEVNDKYQSLVLLFKKGIVSRFKKLSKQRLASSNAVTMRNNLLLQGTLFPDYTTGSLIEIGYVINPLWTEFERLVIVKREGKVSRVLINIPSNDIVEPVHTATATEVDLNIDNEDQLTIKAK